MSSFFRRLGFRPLIDSSSKRFCQSRTGRLTRAMQVHLAAPKWKKLIHIARGVATLLVLGVTVEILAGSACNVVVDGVYFFGRKHSVNLRALSNRIVGRPMDASTPLSSTPYLKFAGNQTVLVPAADSSGNLYGEGLLRQPDCSITEYLVGINTGAQTVTVNSSVPEYQDTLHSLAGLTTAADRWPNGCKSPVGNASSQLAVNLGLTKSGGMIGAVIDPQQALHVGVVNLAAGSSSPIPVVSSVPNPNSLGAADVNGDGNIDLIVTDYPYPAKSDPGGVYVFLSNGDGTFKTPVDYAAGTGPAGVTIGDVNNDGKLDLVISSGLTMQTLLGNGDGTFQTAISSTSTGAIYPALGDFNGDGNLDLVLDDGAIQLGDGDGHFASAAFTLPFPPAGGANGQPGVPVVGDFNNDGKQDIAINDEAGPFINIYLGKGDGTFTTGPSYATIYGTTDLAAADLDGDGNLDLVVGNGNGGLFGPDENSDGLFAVLMGNGDGTFQAAPSYAATTDGQSVVGPQFAVADFNGDGKPDILGISTTVQSGIPNPNGLELLTGDGKGNFTPGAPVAGGSPTLVVAADMNGDKNMDAIVADNGSNVGIAFGNGKGGFQAIADYAVPNSETIQDLAVGDFNGDGKPDVLVTAVDSTGGNPNGIYLFLNNGDGTLAAAKQLDTAINPYGLAVGDLNGDGKLDFVMTDNGASFSTNTQGSMRIYLGDGNGAFANPTSYNPGFSPTSVVIADMNKDGKPDLLVDSTNQAFTSGTLSIYLGNGDGTLQTPLNTALVDAGVGNLTVGDFDGDGNPDVAVADCCGLANSSILFGKGDGAIASQYLLAIGISSNSITAVDVNGDNRPDLVLSLEPASAIQVFLNLYGQASTAPPPPTSGTPDFSLGVGSNSLSIAPGQSGTDTISVKPVNGFNQATSFTCSGLPSETSCSFSPASVMPNGTAAGTTMMTITTTAVTSSRKSLPWPFAGGGIIAACGLLFIGWKKRLRLPAILSLVLVLCTAGIMLGCGGSSAPKSGGTGGGGGTTNPGTPAGTSTVTVTAASGSGTSAISHTATISLTIQ